MCWAVDCFLTIPQNHGTAISLLFLTLCWVQIGWLISSSLRFKKRVVEHRYQILIYQNIALIDWLGTNQLFGWFTQTDKLKKQRVCY